MLLNIQHNIIKYMVDIPDSTAPNHNYDNFNGVIYYILFFCILCIKIMPCPWLFLLPTV